MVIVMDLLKYEYPLYARDYSGVVSARARKLLAAEFKELSDVFTALYKEFDIRYFDARLPYYAVRVMHNVPIPNPMTPSYNPCAIDHGKQELVLDYDGMPEFMITQLVDRMAHIHTEPTHGPLWRKEMDRLMRVGAPTMEQTQRLEAVGWKPCLRLLPGDDLATVLSGGGNRDVGPPVCAGDGWGCRLSKGGCYGRMERE
jgi:hypothetical protein